MKPTGRENIKDILKTYCMITLMAAAVICTSLFCNPKSVQASEIDTSTENSTICTSAEASDVETDDRHPGMCQIRISGLNQKKTGDLPFFLYVEPGTEYVIPENFFPLNGDKFRFWTWNGDFNNDSHSIVVKAGDVVTVTHDSWLHAVIF